MNRNSFLFCKAASSNHLITRYERRFKEIRNGTIKVRFLKFTVLDSTKIFNFENIFNNKKE